MNQPRIMIPDTRQRRWAVHAKKPDGSVVDLTRTVPQLFPPTESEDEQWDRIIARIEGDAQFCVTWRGCFFYLADVFRGIEMQRVQVPAS